MGSYTSAESDEYLGEWRQDMMEGQGRVNLSLNLNLNVTTSTSTSTSPQPHNRNLKSPGRLMYRSTGDVLEGSFVGGKPHGLGTYTSHADGKVHLMGIGSVHRCW